MAQQHFIGTVKLQVRAPRQADGFALQQNLSRWFWDEFLPVLDAVLSELAPEDQLIRLDQLDFELPALHLQQWHAGLTPALEAILREQLGRLILFPGSVEAGKVERLPLNQRHFEAWLWFLENGQLPPQYASAPEEVRLQAVLENVATQSGAVSRLRALLRQSPRALQRLVLQHPTQFLAQLTAAITGQEASALVRRPAELHARLAAAAARTPSQAAGNAPSAGPGMPLRQFETRFWQQLFEDVAAKSPALDVQIFAERFFEKSIQTTPGTASPIRPIESAREAGVSAPPAIPEIHPIQRPATQKSHFETWLWYLQHGRLPPVPTAGTVPERLAAVLDTLTRQPAAVQQWSRLLRHHPKAVQRLVLEHDSVFLSQLTRVLLLNGPDDLPAWPLGLYKILTGPTVQALAKAVLPQREIFNAIVLPVESFAIWFWQELLISIATEMQGFDQQAFAHRFFKRAFALVYRVSFEQFQDSVLSTAILSRKQRALVVQKLERLGQAISNAAPLQEFYRQEIEPLQEQVLTTAPLTAAPSSRLHVSGLPETATLPATETPGEAPAGHWEAWLWYLQHGELPPAIARVDATETQRLAAVLETMKTKPAALNTLKRLLKRQAAALERLVLQHPAAFLADLAAVLSGQEWPELPAQPGALTNWLSGPKMQALVRKALPGHKPGQANPLIARQLELWFWQNLIADFAGKPQQFVYQNFINEFFQKAFLRFFQVSFPEWRAHAIRTAASGEKQRTVLLRQLDAASRWEGLGPALAASVQQAFVPLIQALNNPEAHPPPGSGALETPPASLPGAAPYVSGVTPRATIPGDPGQQARALTDQLGQPVIADTDRPKREPPAAEPPKVQYLQNAGLVLLHPFLSPLFEATGIIREKQFIDETARAKGVQLLHYLAMGSDESPEYELAMPKFLCHMPYETPVDRQSLLTAADRQEGDSLLQAVIRHWGALGQVSNDSLRQGFLQREGKLSRRDGDWLLQMESKLLDILLGRLPWGIGVMKLAWMPEIVHVEWH